MARRKSSDDQIPVYSVRLRDAYLHEAKVSRRSPLKRAVSAPTLRTTIEEWGVDAEAKTLLVVVAADIKAPYRGGQAELSIHASVVGEFTIPEALTEEQALQFANIDAVVILYPYLRSHAGELARMTGLPIPALPTLDVQQFLALGAAVAGSAAELKD